MSDIADVTSKRGPARGRARGAVGRPAGMTGRSPLTGLAPLILLLAVWQLVGSDDSIYFPRPSSWWGAFYNFAASGDLWTATVHTAQTFVLAFIVAIVIGVVLGILTGGIPWVDRMLNPTLEFIRAIPSSAKVPVFVMMMGYTSSMKLVVVVIAAGFPILMNTRSGMREMNPLLFDVGRTLNLSRARTVRKIIIPSLLGPILTGIRIATPVVLIVVLVVEILTKVPGLGGSLSLAQSYYQSSLSYALIVVTTLLALAVNTVIGVLDDRLTRHLRR